MVIVNDDVNIHALVSGLAPKRPIFIDCLGTLMEISHKYHFTVVS